MTLLLISKEWPSEPILYEIRMKWPLSQKNSIEFVKRLKCWVILSSKLFMMLLEKSYLKKDLHPRKLNFIITVSNYHSNTDGRAMGNKSMTTSLKAQFPSSINGKKTVQICKEVCLMKLLTRIHSGNQSILKLNSRSQ